MRFLCRRKRRWWYLDPQTIYFLIALIISNRSSPSSYQSDGGVSCLICAAFRMITMHSCSLGCRYDLRCPEHHTPPALLRWNITAIKLGKTWLLEILANSRIASFWLDSNAAFDSGFLFGDPCCIKGFLPSLIALDGICSLHGWILT